MPSTNTDIRFLKLLTGEDIITEIVETTDEFYRVKNSIQVIMVPTEHGQMGVQVVPFPMVCEPQTITGIRQNNIVAESTSISQQLMNQYNEIFGAGIQVATADQARQILNG